MIIQNGWKKLHKTVRTAKAVLIFIYRLSYHSISMNDIKMNGKEIKYLCRLNIIKEEECVMIKALNKDAAIRYAKNLNLESNEYVIFDLGKELFIVGGSKDAIVSMATEAAESFVRNFQTFIYDEYENEDEQRLQEKLKAEDDFVKMTAEHLIKLLEERKIYTNFLN